MDFLVSMMPPEADVPRPGRRVSWPGEDREWLWTGLEWIPGRRIGFDGGDSWLLEEGLDEAA